MKNFSGYTFCFMGRSGAGKDSQVKFLNEQFAKSGNKVLIVSTSNQARMLMAKGTSVGNWIKEVLDAGHFFEDWLAISLWMSVVQNDLYDKDILMFGSSPRKATEARIIDKLMTGSHRPLPIPIHLKIDDDEAMRRLLERGRDDDRSEIIKERLLMFKQFVEPIFDYYGDRLVTVDGNGSVEEVSQRLLERLNNLSF